MNKRFIRVAVFCALTATAAPVFVGCSDDYDADIANLQDQINKINGVIGVSGDDMAAAIDQVVEQMQTRIDELSATLEGKVNVDELTASVDNLKGLIDQKADPSAIEAEATRLEGLIDEANKAAADASEEVRQNLEQQISELEQKQDEAQLALNEALNGKVSQDVLDKEAARLEELINDAKQIASGAVTPAQLDEKINTVMGEIEAAVEGKVTTAELEALRTSLNDAITAATNDMATNAAVQEKLDALDAELTEAIGKKMDISTFNSLKNQLTTAIGAKADTAFVNQEIRDLNAELENVKAGYATTAITDQLRADLTTVTNDLTTASNKLQEVDRISTDLGVAIKDLTTVKGDLEGLKDRIEDLEGADLNLSEYSEFTALANRVQTLEGKWGELSWEDIDANTSAIEQINLKLNAFFAEKADATAKDIYNKLVALETWKTDVVEQFMSGITNSEATGKLDQALADIEDLRTQLGLIAKDPEEGEEGEEPTANFYDKATIDEMFKKVEGEMAMLFDTPNSLVYIPNFDASSSQFSTGITVKSLFITGNGLIDSEIPIATTSDDMEVQFRVSPSTLASKIVDGTYTLSLDGKQRRSIPNNRIKIDPASTKDCGDGVISVKLINEPLVRNEAWALCVNLSKTPKEGEEVVDAETGQVVVDETNTITSNYFSLANESVVIDNIKLRNSNQNATKLAYKEHDGETPNIIDFEKNLKYDGYLDGSCVVTDLASEFNMAKQLDVAYEIESDHKDHFNITADGKLSTANPYAAYIGETATIHAYGMVAMPGSSTSFVVIRNNTYGPTTYGPIEITNITNVFECTLANDFEAVTQGASTTEWNQYARTFEMTDNMLSYIVSQAQIPVAEFFSTLAANPVSTSVDAEGKKVTLSAVPTYNGNEIVGGQIYVTYDAGVVLTSAQTLSLKFDQNDLSLPEAEIQVTLPATIFATLPQPSSIIMANPNGIIWDEAQRTATFTPVPQQQTGITAMNWTGDVELLFSATEEYKEGPSENLFENLKTAVGKVGGKIVWTRLNDPIGISGVSGTNSTFEVGTNYDVNDDDPVDNLQFRVDFKYGAHIIPGGTYTLKVADISGTWKLSEDIIKNDGVVSFTDRTGTVKLSTGCTWKDATSANNVVWKDGVVVTTANTKDAAYATSFFSLTGIKAPQFEFVNPVYQQYIDLDPNTGSFKLNEAG